MSIQCQRVWKSWLRFPRNHHVFLLTTIITPVVLAYSLHHATINSYVGHQSFRIFFLLRDVTSRPAHNITTAASFACADHSSQQTACSRVVLGKDAASFTLLTCCLLSFCRSPSQQAKQERAVVVGGRRPAGTRDFRIRLQPKRCMLAVVLCPLRTGRRRYPECTLQKATKINHITC
jgi:hypothetical protein